MEQRQRTMEYRQRTMAQPQRRRRRRSHIHTMDVILVVMALLLITFTITMIVIFCRYQAVPDTLVTAFFSAFGAEGGFMALIMIAKKFTERSKEEED